MEQNEQKCLKVTIFLKFKDSIQFKSEMNSNENFKCSSAGIQIDCKQ